MSAGYVVAPAALDDIAAWMRQQDPGAQDDRKRLDHALRKSQLSTTPSLR